MKREEKREEETSRGEKVKKKDDAVIGLYLSHVGAPVWCVEASSSAPSWDCSHRG